jgi:hypothetical protein
VTRAPLIILGMHRSGTSVVARWLRTCGFDIGQELLESGPGNRDGHFEDLAFLRLHNRILNANRSLARRAANRVLKYEYNYHVMPGRRLHVSPRFYRAAEQLIAERRATGRQWGWKEPRTCLFLRMWKELLPGARAVVVFRHYASVVDSLWRRELHKAQRQLQPVLSTCRLPAMHGWAKNRLLRVWLRYNGDILNYLEQRPRESYTVVGADEVAGCAERILRVLTEQMRYSLQPVPLETIFDQEKISHEQPVEGLADDLVGHADEIMARLRRLSEGR